MLMREYVCKIKKGVMDVERRKFIVGGIVVVCAVTLCTIGSVVVPSLAGPQAPRKGEVVDMVSAVHGDVRLVEVRDMDAFVGLEDVSEYLFEDDDGLVFPVRSAVMEDEQESPVVQDMWADAYLDLQDTARFIEDHGGTVGESIGVPADAEQDKALRRELATRIPAVPDELAGVYYLLSDRPFDVTDSDGNPIQTDLFGYVADFR